MFNDFNDPRIPIAAKKEYLEALRGNERKFFKRFESVKETMQTSGFTLFKEFIQNQRKSSIPKFENKDQLDAYHANNLVLTGLEEALKWFLNAESDYKQIKESIQKLESELNAINEGDYPEDII